MSENADTDTVRHKIVEHVVGGGRYFACRCLCGWEAKASTLPRLDAMCAAHIDGC